MSGSTFSRRSLLGGAAAIATVPLLTSCNVSGGSTGPGSGGAAAELKFWDMPWGSPAYTEAAKKNTESYAPAEGLGKATYQSIQWNGFYQTFSSAIASGTGPAVSTGAGFQAFQFAEQGAIAYADNLLESMKKDGSYDDFLPGVVETMKTDKGYVAVPWLLDVRVLWYNKALLDEAGTKVPTTWDELLETGKALKKIGVSGFATGSGTGNTVGMHTMVAMMINNGGGMFDEDGNPDCVTPENIEAMEFVRELVGEGIVDKGAVSYTTDNVEDQWNTRKAGLGIWTPGLVGLAPNAADDLVIASPLTSPTGKTGGLYFVNNIMMYTKTPSQENSEAFVKHYLSQLHTYWDQNLGLGVPALKSIAESPTYAGDPNNVKVIQEWVPVCKGYSAKKDGASAVVAAVDGGQDLSQFAQTMLQGQTDPKAALTTLQRGIEALAK